MQGIARAPAQRPCPNAGMCRCDEEAAEDEVKKRSATKDAMGAKTLCLPLEQVGARAGVACLPGSRSMTSLGLGLDIQGGLPGGAGHARHTACR